MQFHKLTNWFLTFVSFMALTLSLEASPHFSSEKTIPIANRLPGRILDGDKADLNRDTRQDLVILLRTPSNELEIIAYYGSEDSTSYFTQGTSFRPVAAGDTLKAGDFDRDGSTDILLASRGKQQMYLLRGAGAGKFLAPVLFPAGGELIEIVVSDVFEADGREDVVLLLQSQGQKFVHIFQGREPLTSVKPVVREVPAESKTIHAANVDADHYRDVAVIAGKTIYTIHGLDASAPSDQWKQLHPEWSPVTTMQFQEELDSFVMRPLDRSHKGFDTISTTGRITECTPGEGCNVAGTLRERGSILQLEDSFLVQNAGGLSLVEAGNNGKSKQPVKEGRQNVKAIPARLNKDGFSDLIVLSNDSAGAESEVEILPTLPAAIFTVNTVGGNGDVNVGDGVCADVFNTCTLRAAIEEVNVAGAGNHQINFAIGSGHQPLNGIPPAIKKPVLIDGTTQPGYAGAPLIEVAGVVIEAPAVVIKGLILTGGPGPQSKCVFVNNTGNTAVYLESNYIGTNAAGNAAPTPSCDHGVYVKNANLRIGDGTVTGRNVINGGLTGINLDTACSAEVSGNYIGTNAAGNSQIANLHTLTGIATSYGTIAYIGFLNKERNIIAGVIRSGISADGYAVIQNNFIGLNKSGQKLGNGEQGINASGANILIEKNVISGNAENGIRVTGNIKMVGNFIGTDPTGSFDVGNSKSGIAIVSGTNASVGSTETGSGNVISGNDDYGILISGECVQFIGCGETSNNYVYRNLIGTNPAGTLQIGNEKGGVYIGERAMTNIIGGTWSLRNTIAFNKGDGVIIYKSKNNDLSFNSIHSNSGLGIDLEDDGVTFNDANDADQGDNELQNYPAPESAQVFSDSVSIHSTLTSMPSKTYVTHYYSSPACDISGFGEGAKYLGSAEIAIPSNTDTVRYTVAFAGQVTIGHYITAIATDISGNSSEFSECIPVTGAPRLVIDVAGLSSDNCSLGGGGSANNVIDPGEDIELYVQLRNKGSVGATNIVGTLMSFDPDVMITADTQAYGFAGPNDTAISPPFMVSVSSNAACGKMIPFTILWVTDQGTWSESFNMQVGSGGPTTVTLKSTDVPKSIIDSGTVESKITSFTSGTISDVNVKVAISHSFDEDLDIFLVAPDNTVIELSSDNGGANDNYTDTVFDDEANAAITTGTAPFSGTFKPETPLSALDGKSATGIWSLRVTDDAAQDVGAIHGWTLSFTFAGNTVCTKCNVPPPGETNPLKWSINSKKALEWDPTTSAKWYTVYRGSVADLPKLLNNSTDSCNQVFTTNVSTGNVLTQTPAPGEFYWYIVRAGNSGGEGSPGNATGGMRIHNTSGNCPLK